MDSSFGCDKIPHSAAERFNLDYYCNSKHEQLHEYRFNQRNEVFLPRFGERGRFNLEQRFGDSFSDSKGFCTDKCQGNSRK